MVSVRFSMSLTEREGDERPTRRNNMIENNIFSGDWSKAGAVFSAEDLALLDSTGRPAQVSALNKDMNHKRNARL